MVIYWHQLDAIPNWDPLPKRGEVFDEEIGATRRPGDRTTGARKCGTLKGTAAGSFRYSKTS